ncbi:hypothetical protein QYE76_056971 [Lolium multiflorum]|uniref:Uncharacterized protein n=1 Tax=Lolium multiflorum TaxID=4521 RepID=A0AAD8WNC9_LOLMU|nr:hypothetical protein QYE76_056971 [Lolium multiflorum]
MGHGLHEYTRRHGGNKMPIEFTPGVRRPKDYVQSAKLSNEGKFNMDKNDEVAQDVCTDMLQLVLSEKAHPPPATAHSYQDWASQQVPGSLVSATRIRELQQRLADQEQNSIRSETYHGEMQAKLQEQDEKFEEIRKKQEEELEAVKKAQEEKIGL